MTPPMAGGCLCGAVRYECSGEPVFSLLCHCRDCQRQSGSAYAAAVRVPAASWVTRGEPKLYVKTSDSGNQVTRAFCPECGCMLFLQVSARPDLVGIRVGTLDCPPPAETSSGRVARPGRDHASEPATSTVEPCSIEAMDHNVLQTVRSTRWPVESPPPATRFVCQLSRPLQCPGVLLVGQQV